MTELSEWVGIVTGADSHDPDFAIRDDQPCAICGQTAATAILSFDGEAFDRWCLACAVAA